MNFAFMLDLRHSLQASKLLEFSWAHCIVGSYHYNRFSYDRKDIKQIQKGFFHYHGITKIIKLYQTCRG